MASNKEWLKGRDQHSGLRLRNIELELEGEDTPRKFQAWRVWEKPEGKTGFQLSNKGLEGVPERWQWFDGKRIVSMIVEPVAE
jgi:hypothetical protein